MNRSEKIKQANESFCTAQNKKREREKEEGKPMPYMVGFSIRFMVAIAFISLYYITMMAQSETKIPQIEPVFRYMEKNQTLYQIAEQMDETAIETIGRKLKEMLEVEP